MGPKRPTVSPSACTLRERFREIAATRAAWCIARLPQGANALLLGLRQPLHGRTSRSSNSMSLSRLRSRVVTELRQYICSGTEIRYGATRTNTINNGYARQPITHSQAMKPTQSSPRIGTTRSVYTLAYHAIANPPSMLSSTCIRQCVSETAREASQFAQRNGGYSIRGLSHAIAAEHWGQCIALGSIIEALWFNKENAKRAVLVRTAGDPVPPILAFSPVPPIQRKVSETLATLSMRRSRHSVQHQPGSVAVTARTRVS